MARVKDIEILYSNERGNSPLKEQKVYLKSSYPS